MQQAHVVIGNKFIAETITNARADLVEGKDFIQSLKASKIFNLNSKNSLYMRLQAQGINSDTYLPNELIRFGGINSIRGFEENSINATLLSVLASEYRYQLSPRLYVHSIIDASYFETPTLAIIN